MKLNPLPLARKLTNHDQQPANQDQPVATGQPSRPLRFATVTATTFVAGTCAVVSYRHALEIVRASGETGFVAYLVPGSTDGVIFAASMVILNAARTGTRVPWLAYPALAFGVLATMAMNVAAGLQHGMAGALVSALPAVALVLAYELLMMLVRGSRAMALVEAAASHPEPAVDQCPHGVATSAEHAVQLAYLHGRDCVGDQPSQRHLAEVFAVNRARVAALVRAISDDGQDEPTPQTDPTPSALASLNGGPVPAIPAH